MLQLDANIVVQWSESGAALLDLADSYFLLYKSDCELV